MTTSRSHPRSFVLTSKMGENRLQPVDRGAERHPVEELGCELVPTLASGVGPAQRDGDCLLKPEHFVDREDTITHFDVASAAAAA